MTTTPDTLAKLAADERTELLDWVSACQSAYHIDSTPGHRFGGLGSNLDENREALVDHVESIIAERVRALTAQALPAAEPAKPLAPRLLGWRTDDYLNETADKAMADNWAPHHNLLPIFEGDPYTKLAPQAAQQAAQAPAGWQPIESAEEGLLYVVAWVDPEDGLERHDFDALEDGVWQQHADSVEHFQMCAPPGSRGPKERPPYTHCLKLSALPQPPQPQEDA